MIESLRNSLKTKTYNYIDRERTKPYKRLTFIPSLAIIISGNN